VMGREWGENPSGKFPTTLKKKKKTFIYFSLPIPSIIKGIYSYTNPQDKHLEKRNLFSFLASLLRWDVWFQSTIGFRFNREKHAKQRKSFWKFLFLSLFLCPPDKRRKKKNQIGKKSKLRNRSWLVRKRRLLFSPIADSFIPDGTRRSYRCFASLPGLYIQNNRS
jgi:hypothetical protein